MQPDYHGGLQGLQLGRQEAGTADAACGPPDVGGGVCFKDDFVLYEKHSGKLLMEPPISIYS